MHHILLHSINTFSPSSPPSFLPCDSHRSTASHIPLSGSYSPTTTTQSSLWSSPASFDDRPVTQTAVHLSSYPDHDIVENYCCSQISPSFFKYGPVGWCWLTPRTLTISRWLSVLDTITMISQLQRTIRENVKRSINNRPLQRYFSGHRQSSQLPLSTRSHIGLKS